MARCPTPSCPTRGRELEPGEIEYFADLGVHVCKHCLAELPDYVPVPGAAQPAPRSAPPEPPRGKEPAIPTARPAPAARPEATPVWEIEIPEPAARQVAPPIAIGSAPASPPPAPSPRPPEPASWAPSQLPPVIGPAAPPDDEDAIAGSADDFVMAGAQAFPRIEVYQGQAVRGRYEVRGDVFVIGRLSRQLGGVPDLDFSSYADGKQVSRHHARIVQDSGAYYVEDLESAAGTWLNGELLVPNRPYPLRDDDEINIGEVATLVFLLP